MNNYIKLSMMINQEQWRRSTNCRAEAYLDPSKIERWNCFAAAMDDTTMEAVQLQLASISIRPIEMTSKCPEIATSLFVFERASRGHLARLNWSPDEKVMVVLHKSRSPERNARPGSAKRPG